MNQSPIRSLMLNSELNSFQLSDEDVILQYKSTFDNYYVGILFRRYADIIFGICLKYLKNRRDAEDLMVEIYEKLGPVLLKSEIDKFRNWLYILVKNHCVSKLRSSHTENKKIQSYKEYVEVLNISMSINDSDETFSALGEEMIISLIDQLPDMQKKCIKCFYFQEISYKDISEMTGEEVGKIRSYIQNGRRNLKLMLSKVK